MPEAVAAEAPGRGGSARQPLAPAPARAPAKHLGESINVDHRLAKRHFTLRPRLNPRILVSAVSRGRTAAPLPCRTLIWRQVAEEAEEVTERASSAAKGGARRRGKRPSARHRWAGSHPPNEAPCPGQKLGRRALPTGTRAGNEGLRWSPALQWPPARGGRGDLLGEEWGRRSEPSLHSRDTETPEVEGLRMLHLDPKSTGYGRGDAPAADLVGRWAGGLSPSGYQKLEGQFDYRAFVSVSQKPDMKKILRNNTLPVQLPRVWW
nr:unnamed protein product [Digitaria exilis]